MGVNKNVYVILGYDLVKCRKELLKDDFIRSDRGEELTCYQIAGKIQLFYDSMSENYLYLGYVLGNIEDGYEDAMIKTTMMDFAERKEDVDKVLYELLGKMEELEFQHIVFTEYR